MTDKEVPGEAGYNIDQFTEEDERLLTNEEIQQAFGAESDSQKHYLWESGLLDALRVNAKAQLEKADRLLDREKIAIEIWAYPVLHSWLTFEDAKTYPNWQDQVKCCYSQADQIIATCKGEWNEREMP